MDGSIEPPRLPGPRRRPLELVPSVRLLTGVLCGSAPARRLPLGGPRPWGVLAAPPGAGVLAYQVAAILLDGGDAGLNGAAPP
jgi:hypothetical protein